GIRDPLVTGVQTCALPISCRAGLYRRPNRRKRRRYQRDCPASLVGSRTEDSDNSSNHSDEPRKVGGFPLEPLDAFDRNQWMTCPEYADMPEGVSQICFWSFTRFPQPKIEIDQDP